jgi:hypothetical protein
MSNYEKLHQFLKENEGKKMDIGIHLNVSGIYNTVENWKITVDEISCFIITENQHYEFFDNGDIENIEINPDLMSVYPEDGSFEIYTNGASIGFMLR